MAKDKFIVVPGIHNVPDVGRIDCNKSVNDAVLVKLYLSKYFKPLITATEAGVKLLKKEKLTDKQIAGLIQGAKSADEVNWLLNVKSTNALKKIAEVKINSFS